MTLPFRPHPDDPDADHLNTLLDAMCSGTRARGAASPDTDEAVALAYAADKLRELVRRVDVPAAAYLDRHPLQNHWEDIMNAAFPASPAQVETSEMYAPPAPVSNRVRRATIPPAPHRLNAWLSAAIVAVLLLGTIGGARWRGVDHLDPGSNGRVRLAAITENAGTPIATPSGGEWWTAWSTCAINPVHTEAPPANGPHMLPGMPWLRAETLNGSNSVLYVWLWTGNRPLPVDGEYSNEHMSAKWLWEFVPPMEQMSITATNERGARGTVEYGGPVLSSSTGGNEWPSTVVLPEPGCWTFDITATAHDGEIYEGRIVFPAVP